MIKKYYDGEDFRNDNKEILDFNPITTSFMKLNSYQIHEFSKDKFMFKVITEDKYLLVLYLSPFNMLLFGDESLSIEAIEFINKNGLPLTQILAPNSLGKYFLDKYVSVNKGCYRANLQMDIMKTSICNVKDFTGVFNLTSDDYENLCENIKCFELDALKEVVTVEEIKKKITLDNIKLFYGIKINDELVSIAKITREDEKIAAISVVYTKPEYRGQGFSKMVVGYITNKIISSGKIAYLYVDKKNPISNKLYLSIGYNYIEPFTEFHYTNSDK